MSHYDYERSQAIATEPFYAFIMAAIRHADTDNLAKLRAAFPETHREFEQRYHAAGGLLPHEASAHA